jgi:hypothetical protein
VSRAAIGTYEEIGLSHNLFMKLYIVEGAAGYDHTFLVRHGFTPF